MKLAAANQDLERMKILVNLMPSADSQLRDLILNDMIRALKPELATAALAVEEGSPNLRAQLYKTANIAGEDELLRLQPALTLLEDWSYRSVEPVVSSSGVKTQAVVGEGYIPFAFLPDGVDPESWSLVDFNGELHPTKIIESDATTGVTVLAKTNTNGLMPAYPMDTEPKRGTLVYFRDERMKSKFFVTQFLGMEGQFVKIKDLPDTASAGTVIYGPSGAIGVIRNDRQVLSINAAWKFVKPLREKSENAALKIAMQH